MLMTLLNFKHPSQRKQGAIDVNHLDSENFSALDIAIGGNKDDVVKYLLLVPGINQNIGGGKYGTTLNWSVANLRFRIVHLLLKK